MITSIETTSIADILLEELPRRVSKRREDHIHRVTDTIDALALRFGIDRNRARVAAIAHDLDRDLSPGGTYSFVADHRVALYPAEWRNPKMVHGAITSVRLRREFGLTDSAVLHAVRHHTLGHPDFDAIGKALFVADYIEPGRTRPTPEDRDRIREASTLDRMVLRILEWNREVYGPLEEPTAGLYARLREGM